MNIIDQARKIRADMNTVTSGLTDEQGLNLIALFEPWQSDTLYTVGDRRKHGDKLYKCIQSHTSQSNWTPDATPALWKVISVEEWPEWVQPIGAQDAYQIGDKVSHNGKLWISIANNNVWEPGVYGWVEQ